ncbi:MAG TPA: hypothetical protein VIS07_03225 [Candidatus Binatia bacterium]
MKAISVLALAVALATPCAPAFAQGGPGGSCLYNGRRYANSVAVCQAGQVQVCVGGEWQTQGRFCQEPDGTILGVPILGPGQVNVAPGPPPMPPAEED